MSYSAWTVVTVQKRPVSALYITFGKIYIKTTSVILKQVVISETVKDKPKIVTALGSVPKPQSNDLRIIHDCSRPVGASLNTYASLEKEK